MQRDEFLPLRVIRQELAAAARSSGDGERKRRASGAARRAIQVEHLDEHT